MPAPGLYPRGAPRPTTSKAEQQLHRALADKLPEGWYAWHSLRVRDGASYEGEGDFVIAIPDSGILILEVKGGAIEVRDGQWLQNGRPMRRPPRDQAHRFQRKLKDKLEAALGSQPQRQLPWMAIATAFPDTPYSAGPSEGAVAGATLGQHDLPYLDDALPALAERVFKDTYPPRDRRWVDALHNLWCETWTPALTLGDRARLRADELVALDAQQLKILDHIDQNPRVLITGGPGTGKTLIARDLYRRLEARGRRPLLLCSTLALAAGLRADGLTQAFTLRDYAARLLHEAGIPMQGGVPKGQWSAQTWDLVPLQAAADALPAEGLPHDALVLDEAQDLPKGDWDFLDAIARDGVFWAFADEGQSFWRDRGVPKDRFAFSFKLTDRYRCPEPLAAFADRYRPDATTEPPKSLGELRVVTVPTAMAIDKQVAKEIQRALGDGAAPGDIAVLTLGGQTRTSLGVADRIGSHPVVRANAPAAHDQIICDTFLRFKGLERPHVIVTELSAAHGHQYDVRMHIALTRATVGCVVVATAEAIAADARLSAAKG